MAVGGAERLVRRVARMRRAELLRALAGAEVLARLQAPIASVQPNIGMSSQAPAPLLRACSSALEIAKAP
jgi:hypothetical protein